MTLEQLLRDWLAVQRWTEATRARVTGRLERHILATLGQRPAREITAPELLEVLRLVEQAGTIETQHSYAAAEDPPFPAPAGLHRRRTGQSWMQAAAWQADV
ncbi:MAG: phage integrase central domain-containing protein [Ectothiorhodospira sp.]